MDYLLKQFSEVEYIQLFLNKVKTENRYAVYDVDGTVFSIPTFVYASDLLLEKSNEFLRTRKSFKKGNIPQVDYLKMVELAYKNRTTKEIKLKTGIEAEILMSSEIHFEIGKQIGVELVKKNLYFPSAFDSIKFFSNQQTRVVFLTTTIRPYVSGVITGAMNTIGMGEYFNKCEVIGSEITFDLNGNAKMPFWCDYTQKGNIVKEIKSLGGKLVFAAGDDPLVDGAFMNVVKNSGGSILEVSDDNSWKEYLHKN